MVNTLQHVRSLKLIALEPLSDTTQRKCWIKKYKNVSTEIQSCLDLQEDK